MINQKKILSLCTLTIPWDVFALMSNAADKKRLWKVNNGLFPRLTLDISYLYAKNNLGGDVVHAD